MKQKNMILVAVAVGCGLVAAFLTSQMGAAPVPEVETIEIPVAAVDLNVGTKFTKEELKKLVTYKRFAKDNLPVAYVSVEDELTDKRLTRTIRQGESFNPADLTTNIAISPPPGYSLMTIPATSTDAAAGFAGPGSKVDLIASIPQRSREGQAIVIPLLIDMLVLAIDTNKELNNQGAYQNLSMVSLAVLNEDALILQGALSKGSQLRLMLRNPDKPQEWKKLYTKEEIWAILADEPPKPATAKTEEKKEPEMVKLPVPTADLPAGTQLTEELLDTKFKLVDFTPPAPANIVQDLRVFTGQYLTQSLAANQFVPKGFIGAKPWGKAEPTEDPSSPKAPLPDIVVKPQEVPQYHDATVQTASGTRTFRYQKLKNGEFKYVGEVRRDTSVPSTPSPWTSPSDENEPAQPGTPSTPKAAPQPEGTPPSPGPKKPSERVIGA